MTEERRGREAGIIAAKKQAARRHGNALMAGDTKAQKEYLGEYHRLGKIMEREQKKNRR